MIQTRRNESPTTEEQLAELRAMLDSASGHRRTVVRPNVITGSERMASGECAVSAPGPVTVVTFYISDCEKGVAEVPKN